MGKTIIETEKIINVSGKYDVLVAGGGIAGVSAALAAARDGAKVVLIEKQCVLGGLATAGLITIYLPLCDGRGHQVSFGIAEELFKKSIVYGAEALYPKAWLEGGSTEDKEKQRYEVQFNPHLFAIEIEKELLNANVKILYDTRVCDAIVEDSKIKYVIYENKSGRMAIEVKSVVDTTGDADICAFSGVSTSLYKPGNILAAWTYGFCGGKVKLNPLGCSDRGNTELLISNMVFGGIDGDEISRMLTLSHQHILNDFLEKRKTHGDYVPVTMATMPQLRMTRRICGEYTLDDKEEHTYFENSIGLISDWRKRGPVYEVPFTTLYSSEMKNLICAGRCISVSDEMWDISRVIPACAVTGQAAGTAASMTDDFSSLDISKLQSSLKSDGVVIHENDL